MCRAFWLCLALASCKGPEAAGGGQATGSTGASKLGPDGCPLDPSAAIGGPCSQAGLICSGGQKNAVRMASCDGKRWHELNAPPPPPPARN